jgi:hypothetical protein
MQSGARIMSVGMQKKSSHVSALARATFFEAWGYTPDEQIALEEYYDSLVLGSAPRTIENFSEYLSSPF